MVFLPGDTVRRKVSEQTKEGWPLGDASVVAHFVDHGKVFFTPAVYSSIRDEPCWSVEHFELVSACRQESTRMPGGILFTAAETKQTFDSGASKGSKPVRMDLIPWQALAELGYAFGKGAEKYGEHNNEAGMPYSMCIAALERHLLKYKSGEQFDKETGIHHLAAVMFYCSTLILYEATGKGTDDRSK